MDDSSFMPPSSSIHPSRGPAAIAAATRRKVVTLLTKSRQEPTLRRRCLYLLGLYGSLLGAAGIVSLCLWMSFLLVVRPHPPRWIAQRLPYFDKGWGDMPTQSWDDITTKLEAQGREAGELITLLELNNDPALTDLRLLPVFATQSPCARTCEAIIELRLYGVHHRDANQLSLQLLDRITVKGAPEEEVVDPTWYPATGVIGSTQPLPLESIDAIQTEGLPGVWFNLTGQWRHQGDPILHGQILHVDPQLLRLRSLLNWSSQTRQRPTWKDLDGIGLPELVVNQSVGLEPRFSAYAITSRAAATISTVLEEIPLNSLSLPTGMQSEAYSNALFLAQNGLWSQAYQQLVDLKQQSGDYWFPQLEQQLQVVAFHGDISRKQAGQEWSQSSQKMLALLLDGQWDAAEETLKLPDSDVETVVLPLLRQNSTRVWQRLTATLQLNPGNRSARLWGALVLLAREDETTARQWLAQGYSTGLNQKFAAIAAQIRPSDSFRREPTDEDSPRPQREPSITATSEQPEADPEIVPVQSTEPLPLESEERAPIPLTPPTPEVPEIPETPLPVAPVPEAPTPEIPNVRPVQPQGEAPEENDDDGSTS
ncbi:MAG: hypothetical protein AAFX01_00170 [Cyanobacteria bacterium J06638_28]